MLLMVLAIGAAAMQAAIATAQETTRQSVPVKLANRTVIVVRGPIAGYGAGERAKAATERIERALETDPFAAISFEEMADVKATRVLLGGRLAYTVTPVDIDANSGETTQVVAHESAKRLEQAMAEWREQGRAGYLAVAAAAAVAATLVYLLVAWLLYRGNRWIGGRLSSAAARHSERIRVAGVSLFDAAHVLVITQRAIALVAVLVGLVLTGGWLSYVLVRFPYTRPWGEQLEGNVLALLKEIVLAIAEAMPGLMLVVVIIFIARAISRAVEVFFARAERGRITLKWLDSDTVAPTRRIVQFVIWVFALAMSYPYLPGASTDAFKGLSVLVGVMVSLGGASVIGQAFNGLILMYTRSYRRGEYVRVGESEGTVTDLGLFTTRIRTGMGEEITLPNSGVMSATIRNYSRAVPGTGYVVDTVVTIGYSTPWRQVQAMLFEAARRTADIMSEPSPIVRQTALSDFYVEYRLAAYTPVASPAQRIDVLSQLHGHIQDVFNEYGVQIMSPHYMVDPAAPLVVPKKDWYAPPAQPPEGKEKGS
jgi:small-conductance mechanosensitive channel